MIVKSDKLNERKGNLIIELVVIITVSFISKSSALIMKMGSLVFYNYLISLIIQQVLQFIKGNIKVIIIIPIYST